MKLKDFLGEIERHYVDYDVCPMVVNSTGVCLDYPYLSSVRSYDKLLLPNIIVSSQDQAIAIVRALLPFSKAFMVDIEKKISFSNDNTSLQLGNIYTVISELNLPKINLIPFKANDITVQSCFNTLFNHFGDLAGCSIGIIGIGNIGTKLSLALVETGVNVFLLSRSYERASSVSAFVNGTKSRHTLSTVSPLSNIDQIAFKSDAIVLCGNYPIELTAFARECINRKRNTSLLLQVGHDILVKEDIKFLSELNPFLARRLDISTEVFRLMSSNIHIPSFVSSAATLLEENSDIVSHGYMPANNENIVNDVHKPITLVRAGTNSSALSSLPFISGELS